mmetsp:Transcript_16938/g.47746  ORF Transcript_16938/g.47746 Transcript_16938/m.47746 type:complete len:335 (-) Transcript_16938:497-1501(-)
MGLFERLASSQARTHKLHRICHHELNFQRNELLGQKVVLEKGQVPIESRFGGSPVHVSRTRVEDRANDANPKAICGRISWVVVHERRNGFFGQGDFFPVRQYKGSILWPLSVSDICSFQGHRDVGGQVAREEKHVQQVEHNGRIDHALLEQLPKEFCDHHVALVVVVVRVLARLAQFLHHPIHQHDADTVIVTREVGGQLRNQRDMAKLPVPHPQEGLRQKHVVLAFGKLPQFLKNHLCRAFLQMDMDEPVNVRLDRSEQNLLLRRPHRGDAVVIRVLHQRVVLAVQMPSLLQAPHALQNVLAAHVRLWGSVQIAPRALEQRTHDINVEVAEIV